MPTLPLAGRKIGLLTAYASRLNGGVFEAVVAQAQLIRQLGGEAHIFALTDSYVAEDAARFAPSPVTPCPAIGPMQIGFSPALDQALAAAALDCLHLHGIWMYPSEAGRKWAARTGKPYFISPHGMLDPWITARGRWKKAAARLAYERAAWRQATALHALTTSEARDIAHETRRHDSPIIPNAGPIVSAGPATRAPHVAYIGRIHPKKNLLPLVAAWQSMAAAGGHPAGARLTLAGWGDEADVATLRAAIALAPHAIDFVGPIYGEAKHDLLNSARFIILPSLSEGLPMAILESWATGTPTIMSRHCHLDEGFEANAALECDVDQASITAALLRGWALEKGEWQAMHTAALALAQGRFSPQAVAAQWAHTYGQALSQGPAT